MKHLGKITKAYFGMGGYQDAQFGLTVELSFDGSSATSDFKGTWADYPPHAKYSREDWRGWQADTVQLTRDLLKQAKVRDVIQLVGKPVEVETEGNMLKSWRILTEVL